MKAWIENIWWIDGRGEPVTEPFLPKQAFVQLPNREYDEDEFCEQVDKMFVEKYGYHAGGWSWEIIDVTH